MTIHDPKVGEFTREAEPVKPRVEEWHTFADDTARVLFFHKGTLLKKGSAWGGKSLADALECAVSSAKDSAEYYRVDENSTLQIMVVGARYLYDAKLERRGDPSSAFDRDRYSDRYENRRLSEGPTVGWCSDPTFTELPPEIAERFDNL